MERTRRTTTGSALSREARKSRTERSRVARRGLGALALGLIATACGRPPAEPEVPPTAVSAATPPVAFCFRPENETPPSVCAPGLAACEELSLSLSPDRMCQAAAIVWCYPTGGSADFCAMTAEDCNLARKAAGDGVGPCTQLGPGSQHEEAAPPPGTPEDAAAEP